MGIYSKQQLDILDDSRPYMKPFMYAWYMSICAQVQNHFFCCCAFRRVLSSAPQVLKCASHPLVLCSVLRIINLLYAHVNAYTSSRCIFPRFVPFVVREVVYLQYRGYHCTGDSAEVIRKGMRPANIDFAGLGVSGEGKYPKSWCSAARVFFTCIRASGRACGISVGVNKRTEEVTNWILELRCH